MMAAFFCLGGRWDFSHHHGVARGPFWGYENKKNRHAFDISPTIFSVLTNTVYLTS